jgi:hypothetical protein
MKLRLFLSLLATLVVAAFVTESADARIKDKPNSGYCKSGKHVGDMAKCKENGGAS